MASKAYVNTVSALALATSLGNWIWEEYQHRPNHKTIQGLVTRVKADAQKALAPYLYNSGMCQYDHKTQEKVDKVIAQVLDSHNSEGEGVITWIGFTLAQLEAVAMNITHPTRRAAIDRVIYGVKALSRYFDRNQNSFEDYDRAGQMADTWSEAVAC